MPEQYQLDRDVPIPLYFQIKEMLLRDIHNGVYAMGDQIPTEFALQGHDHISRSTIRQALNELVNEGWLDLDADKASLDLLRQEILDALKVAVKIQKPALEELISDVYAEPIPALQRQYDALKEHIRKYPDAYPVTAGRLA